MILPASCRPASLPRVMPRRAAFTLVELLVVMVIILVLLGIVVPVVISLNGANDINRSAYGVSDAVDQARAYAMANSTYVYLGIVECDVTQSSGGNSRNNPGVGRLVVAAIASRDGTRGYDINSPQTWSSNYPTTISNFVAVGKAQAFDNLHLVNLGAPPASGGMARPAVGGGDPATSFYNLANSPCASVTPFDYPLGTALGAGRYSFVKVIQFDPLGVPRIQSLTNADTVTTYLEIGLQQTHGAAVSALSTPAASGAVAAVQIDGLSSAVRVFRP